MSRLLTLLLPALLFAQEHAEEAAAEPNIMYKWINFGILAAALIYLIAKYLIPALRARAALIDRDLVQSRENVKASEAKVAELTSRLSNFDHEIRELRERSLAERQAEAQRIADHTHGMLAKLSTQREVEITNASRLAHQQLRAFTVEAAIRLAEDRLRAQGESAQPILVQSFLAGLTKVEAN